MQHRKDYKKIALMSLATLILILLTTVTASADTQHEQQELGQIIEYPIIYLPPNFTPFNPTILNFTLPYNLFILDNDYFIWDDHGGWWYDVEKTADNTDDDVMCWAAADSNTMEYSGWGIVNNGTHTFTNTDDIWYHYLDHWKDDYGLMIYGYEWWFENGNRTGDIDVAGGGDFFDSLNYMDYYHETWTNNETVEFIDEMLHLGYATSIGIRPSGANGGHAITVWGYSYNNTVDKETNPKEYYTGLYVTDSDDNKGSNTNDPPPNTLRYYNLTWDSGNDRWELVNYGGGWWIDLVSAIEPRPGNNRPTASGANLLINEGSTATLNGGASSDPDGNPLEYRWEYDDDDFWDTTWSNSPTTTYSWNENGVYTVLLEVFDGVLKDVDEVTVTVQNVAPTPDAGIDQTVDEGETVYFTGSFNDPGSLDSHTIEWDFGDGETASGSLTPNHIYGDNGAYTVTLTVTDDDGGIGTDTVTVTVNNVAPEITSITGDIIDENNEATVSGTFTDPGTDDSFTVTIDWGEGTPIDYNYPVGSTEFSETHQYLDDNPTTTTSDDYTVSVTVEDDDGDSDNDTTTVTVNNLAPTVSAGPNRTVNEGTVIDITPTSYTDTGTLDTHTAVINWGDGTIEAATVTGGAGSGTVTGTHTYGDNGEYIVEITVTDDDGGINSDTLTITVENVAPIVSGITLNQSNPQFILPNVHTLNFTANFTDPGWLDTHTAIWDWGDGASESGDISEENISPDSTGNITGSHVFSDSGEYTVTLTIWDDDGGFDISSTLVKIVTPEEAVQDIDIYIQSLDEGNFTKKAANTKNTLSNMLSAAIDQLTLHEYNGTINHLSAIRSKMDGEGKDWIIDSESQYHLLMKIDDIISYLQTLL